MTLLPGGPPHRDMSDLKLGAPPEICGEFKLIENSAPGIQIFEIMPRMAAVMDKLVVVWTSWSSLGHFTAS